MALCNINSGSDGLREGQKWHQREEQKERGGEISGRDGRDRGREERVDAGNAKDEVIGVEAKLADCSGNVQHPASPCRLQICGRTHNNLTRASFSSVPSYFPVIT